MAAAGEVPALASARARLAAYALDAVALAIPLGILVFSFPMDPLEAVVVSQVLYLVYFVGLWSFTPGGETLGMRVMSIRVVRSDGGRLDFLHAVVRYVALVLGLAFLGVGVVSALFDDHRRGFHDKLAGTLVVDTRL